MDDDESLAEVPCTAYIYRRVVVVVVSWAVVVERDFAELVVVALSFS